MNENNNNNNEEYENVTEQEILDMKVWQLFNTSIMMYLDEQESPYFELYVNGKAFRITIEVEENEVVH